MKKFCNVSHKYFGENMIRNCPHPAVIDSYGINGKCNVSVWICKKCQYAERPVPEIDGYKCNYREEK